MSSTVPCSVMFCLFASEYKQSTASFVRVFLTKRTHWFIHRASRDSSERDDCSFARGTVCKLVSISPAFLWWLWQ